MQPILVKSNIQLLLQAVAAIAWPNFRKKRVQYVDMSIFFGRGCGRVEGRSGRPQGRRRWVERSCHESLTIDPAIWT